MIPLLIGLAIGFSIAKLYNKGYEKTANWVFLLFAAFMACYMGWGLYQVWTE